ncbi:MAG: hypothetical protein QOE93_1164 [Actinomycetota bacterium]|nr:hypothetical protein [Actinomycetota bacterium]
MRHLTPIDLGMLSRFLEPDAANLLDRYFNSGIYTGGQFERFAGGGDRPGVESRFTTDDIVAVSLLGVRIPGRAALELLEAQASELDALLIGIPGGVDLWQAPGIPNSSPPLRRCGVGRGWATKFRCSVSSTCASGWARPQCLNRHPTPRVKRSLSHPLVTLLSWEITGIWTSMNWLRTAWCGCTYTETREYGLPIFAATYPRPLTPRSRSRTCGSRGPYRRFSRFSKQWRCSSRRRSKTRIHGTPYQRAGYATARVPRRSRAAQDCEW